MEDVGILLGHFVHFTAKWYILWPFGAFCGNLVYFSPIWYVSPTNIWQPWSGVFLLSDNGQ
jgi:hypothetical protein